MKEIFIKDLNCFFIEASSVIILTLIDVYLISDKTNSKLWKNIARLRKIKYNEH